MIRRRRIFPGLRTRLRRRRSLRRGQRKNSSVVNRAVVEVAAKIRASSEIQGAKRERAEAEARVKADT